MIKVLSFIENKSKINLKGLNLNMQYYYLTYILQLTLISTYELYTAFSTYIPYFPILASEIALHNQTDQ